MSPVGGGRFRFAPLLAGTIITILLLLLIGSTAEVLLLLFIAVLIALYLDALADALGRHARVPGRFALPVAVLGTLALLAGFFWLLVPPVVSQTQSLLRVLPERIVAWENGLHEIVARSPALAALWPPGQHRVLLAIYDQLSRYFSDVVPKLFGIFHVAINVLSVGIMGLYLAVNPGLYREFLISLFPPVHRDLTRDVLADLGRQLRAYIVGQLAGMTVLAVLTAIGLRILGVPYWLTFGIFTGVAAIVPFFGSLLSTILPALFVIGGDAGVTKALLVVALGVVVHLIEGNIVSPQIMARQIHLPPVLTIMAVLIMGKLLGPVGLLVAVPTLAIVMVVVQRILINRIYEGQGFRRLVRDNAFVVRAPAPAGDILVPATQPADALAIAEAARRGAA